MIEPETKAAALKGAFAWGGSLAAFGLQSWGDVAAMLGAASALLAAIYTALLIVDWFDRRRERNRKVRGRGS